MHEVEAVALGEVLRLVDEQDVAHEVAPAVQAVLLQAHQRVGERRRVVLDADLAEDVAGHRQAALGDGVEADERELELLRAPDEAGEQEGLADPVGAGDHAGDAFLVDEVEQAGDALLQLLGGVEEFLVVGVEERGGAKVPVGRVHGRLWRGLADDV